MCQINYTTEKDKTSVPTLYKRINDSKMTCNIHLRNK